MMTKPNKASLRTFAIVGALLLVAYVCRIPGLGGAFPRDKGLIRAFIYIGLYAAWGFSIRSRIIQPQVRRYLTSIAALMVFWFLVRTYKFHFVSDVTAPDLIRYLWYLYYLPMLFIPLFADFVALSLGRPENSRLPGWTKLLYIPTAALFLLVLTNDLHQLVFTFPADAAVWTDDRYGYAGGYYLVAVWMLLCTLFLFVTMWRKCRVPSSRRRIWQPLAPVCGLFLYMALYYARAKWLLFLAGDMTAASCLLYAAALELCIRCGLIQSNAHYRELFDASTVGARITDEAYQTYLASRNARPVPEAVLRRTGGGPVLLDGGVQLCAAGIRGGHIFWQENVSDLLAVLEQLSDTKEELQEYSRLQEEENKKKQRRCELEEQKRLYDAMRQSVSPAMEQLAALTRRLREAENTETAKLLHGRIAVAGAYLKRRSNLVFLANETGAVASRELLLCLNESVSYLRLAGTACAVKFELEESMDGGAAGLLYDFFETAVETAWTHLPALNVVVTQTDALWQMTLMLQCEADFSPLTRRFADASVERDEDVCYCTLAVRRGGVPV